METKQSVETSTSSEKGFFLVALGASAGGLIALKSFFASLPDTTTNLAFVIIAHLAPDRNSMLASLLQKMTRLPVLQVEEGMVVVPDTVYVIPPNKDMMVSHGVLKLLEIEKKQHGFKPIDTFFSSLGSDWGDKGIGVILSGLGNDGSRGVAKIKSNGGINIAQRPDSAQFDDMPLNAINTEEIDVVLSPDEMPQFLMMHVQQHEHGSAKNKILDGVKENVNHILTILKTASGHDFSSYKTNTICRRIERRMQINHIVSINNYIRYIKESEREGQILFKDLLIGVTSFFRDETAYNLLRQKFLPAMFNDKPIDYQVRVWTPGCSTGEEAYSLAIILEEMMLETGLHLDIQIFATDLDDNAINKARAGIYPESIATDVSKERLEKFFIKTGNRYKIRKNIREKVIFATQNIVKDPPFTKLDLLCCRNLFIYFSQELQARLLPMFHYCLKSEGLLFLGSSETIGSANDLFLPLDKKWKIFKRQQRKSSNILERLYHLNSPKKNMKEHQVPSTLKDKKDLIPIKVLKAILSQSNIPTCVVIDESADILYIHGRAGKYLEPTEGIQSHNIIEMARSGLKVALANAILKVSIEKKQIVLKKLRVEENGTSRYVNAIIKPLPNFYLDQKEVKLIFFEDESPSSTGNGKKKDQKTPSDNKSEEVMKLQEELLYTREYLQATIEELESANEELKSTNEELQSTNEELQSTNDELETSKEELQSLNEESATINAELQNRIDELVEANDDIKNLLDATDIATLFLDINLNVRRFTAKIIDIYPLTVGDIGRSISHFKSNLDGYDIIPCAEEVLKDLEKQELEVCHKNGTVYRMRLRPYRTVNNVIDGVVFTFEDMTEIKIYLHKNQELKTLLLDSADAVVFFDQSGNISAWNKGAELLFGYSAEEAVQMNICTVWGPDSEGQFKPLLKKLRDRSTIPPYIVERTNRRGRQFQALANFRMLQCNVYEEAFIVSIEHDLSSYKKEAFEKIRKKYSE